jgi:hypothetical protein
VHDGHGDQDALYRPRLSSTRGTLGERIGSGGSAQIGRKRPHLLPNLSKNGAEHAPICLVNSQLWLCTTPRLTKAADCEQEVI